MKIISSLKRKTSALFMALLGLVLTKGGAIPVWAMSFYWMERVAQDVERDNQSLWYPLNMALSIAVVGVISFLTGIFIYIKRWIRKNAQAHPKARETETLD